MSILSSLILCLIGMALGFIVGYVYGKDDTLKGA